MGMPYFEKAKRNAVANVGANQVGSPFDQHLVTGLTTRIVTLDDNMPR